MGIYVYGDGGGAGGAGVVGGAARAGGRVYMDMYIYINMLIYSYIYPLLPIVFFQLFRVCKGL